MEKKDYFQIELEGASNLIIPLENTVEVLSIPPNQVCPIPGVKESILGVINYHGRLLWITNITQLLNVANSSIKIRTQKKITIIVLNINGQKIGMVVFKLKGVVSLNSKELTPIEKDYLKAEFKLDTYILKLLDLEQIYSELSHSKLKGSNLVNI